MRNTKGLPTLKENRKNKGTRIKSPCVSIGKHCVLVGLQHIFQTTSDLFADLNYRLNILNRNTFLIGKLYSTDPDAVRNIVQAKVKYYSFDDDNYYSDLTFNERLKMHVMEVWKNVKDHCFSNNHSSEIKHLIILDEGGHLMESIPLSVLNSHLNIIGIEQTTHGLYKLDDIPKEIPIISVASSAAKKFLEPDVISETIVEQLFDTIKDHNFDKPKLGIIGLGAIGKSIINIIKKSSLNVDLNVFDINTAKIVEITNEFPSVKSSKSTKELITNSEIILGCTGKDISDESWLDIETSHPKVLISCSSSDKEFQKLIFHTKSFVKKPSKLFDDILLQKEGNQKFKILFGGYPINFKPGYEGKGKSDPKEKIEITRLLLFHSVVYALEILQSYDFSNLRPENRLIKFDSDLQIRSAKMWLHKYSFIKDYFYRYHQKIVEAFISTQNPNNQWIKTNSGGEELEKVLGPTLNEQIEIDFPSR